MTQRRRVTAWCRFLCSLWIFHHEDAALILALMKIWRVFIIVVFFCKFNKIDSPQLSIESFGSSINVKLELAIVVAEETKIIEYRTVVKSMIWYIADSTWIE